MREMKKKKRKKVVDDSRSNSFHEIDETMKQESKAIKLTEDVNPILSHYSCASGRSASSPQFGGRKKEKKQTRTQHCPPDVDKQRKEYSHKSEKDLGFVITSNN